MLDEGVSVIEGGAEREGQSGEMAIDIFDEPRLSHGASGEEDGVAVGMRKDREGALRVEDVSIADDLDALGYFFAVSDVVPIGGAFVGLGARSSVDANGGSACLFSDPGDLLGIDVLHVPACSDFDGDGDRDRGNHFAEDLSDELRVFEKA